MSWVSSWPAAPDERLALQVFLLARALADEHQIGVGAADAEHDLRATPASLHSVQVERRVGDLGERGAGGRGRMRRRDLDRHRRIGHHVSPEMRSSRC